MSASLPVKPTRDPDRPATVVGDRRPPLRHGHAVGQRRFPPRARGAEEAAAGLADRHRRRRDGSRRREATLSARLLIVVAKAQRQADLFSGEPAMPEGVITIARRSSRLTRNSTSPSQAPQQAAFGAFRFHDFRGRRRVVSFGWRYDYAGRQIRPSADMPEILLPLRQRAADVAGLAAASLQQVLVTEYAPGAPIGRHRDKPMFQDRGRLPLPGPCLLRFRRRQSDGWAASLEECRDRPTSSAARPATTGRTEDRRSVHCAIR